MPNRFLRRRRIEAMSAVQIPAGPLHTAALTGARECRASRPRFLRFGAPRSRGEQGHGSGYLPFLTRMVPVLRPAFSANQKEPRN
jgi:hypothetical protein